jgi:hypothetical protein
MAAFLKDRWVLLLVLIVFVAVKIPHLHYAYYWDESWPYSSAVRAMYDNGLSLLPGAISSDLSRGHPMLFHVLAAGWMHIAGTSHEALHSFSLIISCLVLVSVYEIAARIFTTRAAILAIVFLALQEIFIVQASALVPEMLVALTCLLSIWFYVRKRFLLTALFITMAFFTKESGLMVGMVLGLDALACLPKAAVSTRHKIYCLLCTALPCLLLAAFFVLQKAQFGWYFMPLHLGYIEMDWAILFSQLRTRVILAMFNYGYRYWYFLLPLVAAFVTAIVRKQYKHLFLIAPVIFIWCLTDEDMAHMRPALLFIILFAVVWFALFVYINRSGLFPNVVQHHFLILTGSFVFCYMCFSGISFFTPRYMLAAIVPMLLVTGLLLDAYISASGKKLFYPALIAAGIICYFAIDNNKDSYVIQTCIAIMLYSNDIRS